METVHQLYRERPANENIKKIAELKTIEDTGEGMYELSESERAALLDFEQPLGEKIEAIHRISPVNASFEMSYLRTPSGRQDFTQTFGVELPVTDNQEQILQFLYEQQSVLKGVEGISRTEFEGRGRQFLIDINKTALANTLDEIGAIDVSFVQPPQMMTVHLTPEKTLEKLNAYRAFKTELKKLFTTCDDEHTDAAKAKKDLINIYARRVNELITEVAQSGLALLQKKELGIELTESEQALVEMVYVVADSDQIGSRYDKFIHGVEVSTVSGGNYRQVADELLAYADAQAALYDESIINRERQAAEKGLDLKQLENTKLYQPADVRFFAEEVLRSYGLLSAEDQSTFNPDSKESAADEKWRVIISDSYTSMSIDGVRRVVKIPNKPMSAVKLFSVTLAHEIEGHVLQHENKLKIPLRLFDRVRGDRSVIFSEAGAKYNEDTVKNQAFGFTPVGAPHYVRAMARKLQGGMYSECVETFYESSIAPFCRQYNQGVIDEVTFKKSCKSKISVALKSTQRLFRNHGSMVADSGYLTSSKDTVYLEQVKLVEQLQAAGLDEYLYLSGANVDTLLFLKKANLINRNQLQMPHFESLALWEREKERFSIKKPTEAAD